MPNTGSSTVYTGDETESDLDIEYTSGIATGASIVFVYTGSNNNYGVFDALQYAVDNKLAPVISVSYGSCEAALSSSDYTTLTSIFAQAAAQGQTIVAASGDSGSTDCYQQTSLSTATRQSLAVDFPASSQYVTGLGGTMLTSAAVASGSSYWQSASGSDVISSALSYMPEQVWNNDSTSGLSSGGGGVSTLTLRPSWQTGVAGIPSGSYRLVPDIALASSPQNAGYLYCSSDTQSTGITGSCSHGFRDTNSTYLTVAGGTSFAAPVFAGMLAILNQRLNSSGQGAINSTLYSLAANSSTYASAFHDITSGSNACSSGSSICSTTGSSAYSATTGYDLATGLGSLDFNNLMNVWPGVSTQTASKSFAISAPSTLSITAGSSAAATVTVTPANGYTGTVAYSITVVSTVSNLCYTLPSTVVSGTAAATSTLTIYTTASACSASGVTALTQAGKSGVASISTERSGGYQAVVLCFGVLPFVLGTRKRRLFNGLLACLLAVVSAGVIGCGQGNSTQLSSGKTSSSTNATAGTYTLTITGTDTANNLSSSTTVTLTIS